jgi:hypothetical protein
MEGDGTAAPVQRCGESVAYSGRLSDVGGRCKQAVQRECSRSRRFAWLKDRVLPGRGCPGFS